MRSGLVGLLIGLIVGALGVGLAMTSYSDQRLRDASARASAELATVREESEARIAMLLESQAASDRRFETATASIAFLQRSRKAQDARVREKVAPKVRAKRVAELVAAPSQDVVPYTLVDREGFWVAESVMIDLEAARTASAAFGLERVQWQRAVAAAIDSRRAVEEISETHRAAYERCDGVAKKLTQEVAEATASPSWIAHPAVAFAGGVIVAAGIGLGLALAL